MGDERRLQELKVVEDTIHVYEIKKQPLSTTATVIGIIGSIAVLVALRYAVTMWFASAESDKKDDKKDEQTHAVANQELENKVRANMQIDDSGSGSGSDDSSSSSTTETSPS